MNAQEKLNKRFDELKETIDKSIDEKMALVGTTVRSTLDDGFKNNVEHLDKVNVALGRITESQKNLDALNEQVSTLNNVLSNSQARGKFGEIQLESILREAFGDTHALYDTQYVIKENNKKPDAVIFIPSDDGKLLLCIDSKFSFSEYGELMKMDPRKLETKDVTKLKGELSRQVDKISEDYVIQGLTYPYAIMFIPNDSIYSFIQANDYLYTNIIERARQKNVILVSPSTLQPILMNIVNMNLNHELSMKIKDVLRAVNEMGNLARTLSNRYGELDSTLSTTVKKKDAVGITIRKIEAKSDSIMKMGIKENIIQADDVKVMEEEG